MKRLTILGLLGMGVLSSGCGSAGASGRDGLSAVLSMSDEPAGDNCPNGGKKIDFGTDKDRDGQLDAGEIEGTNYVCGSAMGADGATGPAGEKGDTGTKGDMG